MIYPNIPIGYDCKIIERDGLDFVVMSKGDSRRLEVYDNNALIFEASVWPISEEKILSYFQK